MTVTSASVVQLRTLLRAGIPECDAVRAELTAADTSPITPTRSENSRPIVIGRLYEASRTVRVINHKRADVVAEVSFFEKFLQRFGLGNAKVKAQVVGTSETAAEIVSDQPVAVAFEPAYVTRDMLTAALYLQVMSYDRNSSASISALIADVDGAFTK